MDADNPVVKLCVEGMQAEAQGNPEDARRLYTEAWEARQNDYDACVAAHFLARQQESDQDAFHWNREALQRADAVGDERVRDFYPSLYLNMGRSLEELGNREEAIRYYELAAERIDELEASPYSETVRNGIAEGRKRVGLMEK